MQKCDLLIFSNANNFLKTFKEGILKKNAPTLTFSYTFFVVDKLISYQTSLTIGL